MTRRHVLGGFAIGLLCGCIGTLLVETVVRQNEALQVSYHWRRVASYLRHVHADHGPGGVEDPYDVMPSLAALVSLGELDHVDLVFPRVAPTKEVIRYLQRYFREHEEIVFMEFSPEYHGIRLSGPQPLHLQLWIRRGSRDKLQALIHVIERRYAAKEEDRNKG